MRGKPPGGAGAEVGCAWGDTVWSQQTCPPTEVHEDSQRLLLGTSQPRHWELWCGVPCAGSGAAPVPRGFGDSGVPARAGKSCHKGFGAFLQLQTADTSLLLQNQLPYVYWDIMR